MFEDVSTAPREPLVSTIESAVSRAFRQGDG